jgi:hypothetical protein
MKGCEIVSCRSFLYSVKAKINYWSNVILEFESEDIQRQLIAAIDPNRFPSEHQEKIA